MVSSLLMVTSQALRRVGQGATPAAPTYREEEGVLLVPKEGETLFHLKTQPKWAGGV